MARWIEHNHPDGLIDSEPLEHQLEKIRQRDFLFIESLKRELAEAREDCEVTSRIAEEMTKQRDLLAEALRIIDQRVMEKKDAESDLKFCGEVAFTALAQVKETPKDPHKFCRTTYHCGCKYNS